ncbi:MAG: NUDIX domain-containing protein [Patescibacteria group bacterium]
MRKVTLCFVLKGDEVLLGLKKVRFGSGYWNGFGGGIEEGESERDAACREVEEECELVVPTESLKKVALIHFHFLDKPELDHEVHVFTTKIFSGEPKESEEMRPEWHPISNLPLQEMWPADQHWIPMVLSEGKTIVGRVDFANKEKPYTVSDYNFEEKVLE